MASEAVLNWYHGAHRVTEIPVRQVTPTYGGTLSTHSVPSSYGSVHLRHLDAVHDAAKERDLASLEAAMQALSTDHGMSEVQNLIRSEVLPRLDMKSLLWLWKSITSPLQRREALTGLSNKTASKLCRDGFELGKDFSFAEDSEGMHLMKITSVVKNHLEASLTNKSLVSLQLLTRHGHVSRH